jgi:tetratricopeptide (TPR) repeat protein
MSLSFRSLVLAAGLFLAGCAGHSARTEAARTALDAGRPAEALKLLNEELGVDKPDALPEDVGGENVLLLLDRAMVLQEIGSRSETLKPKEYSTASRDLETADKQVEVLDLSTNAMADIGKYLFSDDSGPYKAPTYEKLMINTMNMVNYLSRGDLNGAKIEARRLAVMQKYISDHEGRGASLTGPGSYLAGFAFEVSGNAQEALRYYDEALQFGQFPSLEEPVRRLSKAASYRSPRLTALMDKNAAGAEASADGMGDILVVINFGRVPAKIAKRIPIGLALTYASAFMSAASRSQANYLAAQGLVTWVNFPELGKSHGAYETPGFALDGSWKTLEGALAVDSEARKAWDSAKGVIVASAITRMIARVVAGEAIRQGSGGGTLGALLSLGTQATLTAVDTPDTRSWATLPARITIGRARVAAGSHVVELQARGVKKRQTVTVSPGGWTVLNLTILR